MNFLETKRVKNNLPKLLLYQIFSNMFFFVPVLVLFWQDKGLNLTQIMTLQSVFAFLMMFLEIPSGYIADIFGRRNTLLFASIIETVAMIIYSLGENFYHFLIGEMIFAVSTSFASGTLSSLAFDTLKNLDKEREYKRIWGNIFFWGMIALSLSNLLGGFIAKADLRYALFASIPFFMLSSVVVFFMQEPVREKPLIKEGYAKELFKTLKDIIRHKKLKWIIIYSAVINIFTQVAFWLYQPYFKFSGMDIAYFGVVFASFQLVSGISSKYAHKIEKIFGKRYLFGMLIFLLAGSFFLMGNFIFWFSFSFAFIQQFVRGIKNIVIADYIHRQTDSSVRATVLSAESFVRSSLFAVTIPFFGMIADTFSMQKTFFIIGVLAIVAGIVILTIMGKERVL